MFDYILMFLNLVCAAYTFLGFYQHLQAYVVKQPLVCVVLTAAKASLGLFFLYLVFFYSSFYLSLLFLLVFFSVSFVFVLSVNENLFRHR